MFFLLRASVVNLLCFRPTDSDDEPLFFGGYGLAALRYLNSITVVGGRMPVPVNFPSMTLLE